MDNNSETENNIVTFERIEDAITYLLYHPEEVTPSVRRYLEKLYSKLCSSLKLSEHSGWGVECKIEKRNKITDSVPYETIATSGNVILNCGANEMLNLVFGTPDAVAFNSTNSKIWVGNSNTTESASQSGLLGGSTASASVESGYPRVDSNSRTAVIRATFGENEANFEWKEISLSNGKVFLNRKVDNEIGTKSGKVWTVEMSVSIVDLAP